MWFMYCWCKTHRENKWNILSLLFFSRKMWVQVLGTWITDKFTMTTLKKSKMDCFLREWITVFQRRMAYFFDIFHISIFHSHSYHNISSYKLSTSEKKWRQPKKSNRSEVLHLPQWQWDDLFGDVQTAHLRMHWELCISWL